MGRDSWQNEARRTHEEVEVQRQPDRIDSEGSRSRSAVKEICRKYGIRSACYYQWKSKFGGLSVSELKRNRELEAENAKLKRMYADLALENRALRDLIEKKL